MRRAAASALRICAQKSFMLRSFPEAVLLPEKFPAGCNPRPILSYCTVLLMQIFFLCSKSSPDVPFGFVYIQHLPGFRRQSGVDLSQAFGYVLMYGCRYSERLTARLQSVLLHPTLNRQIAADKCLHFLPCPPLSSESAFSAAYSSFPAHRQSLQSA